MTADLTSPLHGGFTVVVAATVVVWLVGEVRQGIRRRPEATAADRGSRPVIRLAVAVGVVGAIVAARNVPAAATGTSVVFDWVGLACLWSGIALRFWSFHTLGRYFTFTVQTSADQPVITAGPYRVLRHPSYAGILLVVIGLGLFIGNWLSLVVLTLAVTAGIVYRIRIEERALSAELGDAYAAFAATRKRLVPYVW